jgi:tRNA-dihydrouridine synthase
MIGRAAAARPWIFWQIAQALGRPAPAAQGSDTAPAGGFAEGREFHRALNLFLDAAEEHFSPPEAAKRLRFYVHWGARWLDFGHELWRRTVAAPDFTAVRAVAAGFFARPQRMCERTELRS